MEPNNQPNEVDELRAELAEVEEMQRNMAELLSQVQDGDAGDGDGSDGDDGGDGYGPAEELGADGEPSMHRDDAGEVTAATDATDAMDAMDADLVETCPELTVPQAGEVGEVEVGLGEVELSEGYGFLEAAEHSEVLESLEPLEPSDPGQDGLEDQESQEDREDQEACESETVTLPPSVDDELEEEHWPIAVSFAHLDHLGSVSSLPLSWGN